MKPVSFAIHGYKKEEHAETRVVWVVAQHNFSTLSLNWFHKEEDTRNCNEALSRDLVQGDRIQTFLFPYETEVGLTELELTAQVDDFLDMSVYSSQFIQHPSVIMKPNSSEGWSSMIADYLKTKD